MTWLAGGADGCALDLDLAVTGLASELAGDLAGLGGGFGPMPP